MHCKNNVLFEKQNILYFPIAKFLLLKEFKNFLNQYSLIVFSPIIHLWILQQMMAYTETLLKILQY